MQKKIVAFEMKRNMVISLKENRKNLKEINKVSRNFDSFCIKCGNIII